jgi:plastocyanin
MTIDRHPHRHHAGLVIIALLLGLAAACGGNSTDPTATPETAGAGEIATDPAVAVSDNRFTPSKLTVVAGSTVTWNWTGGTDHNVVGEGFESDTQSSGAFEHRFDTPGTYGYVCTLHAGMNGKVAVVS